MLTLCIFEIMKIKLLLIIGVLFTSLTSLAQEKSEILSKSDDGTYSFEKVYEVAGKSKSEIFESIKLWVISNIKSQSNSNFFDEENKDLISTTPKFTVPENSTVEFKLNIDVKEGKYRLRASSFILSYFGLSDLPLGNYGDYKPTKKMRMNIIEGFDASFVKLLASIENSTADKQSDW